MGRIRRFRRTGRRFATTGEDFAASLSAPAESHPSDNFKLVITALGNLKKAEADFKLTKESDLERLVVGFASQSQTQIDPDALLAWKQSVLAAEVKRADLLAAFDLAEEELSALAKEYARRDAPALLKTIEELFELLRAARTSDDSPAKTLVLTEEFLRELKETTEELVTGKKTGRKKAKQSERRD